MKRLLAPVLQTLAVIPMTAAAIAAEMAARNVGLLPEWNDVIDLPSTLLMTAVVIAVGIPLYWLVNKLIKRIERPERARMRDHLRHACAYYVILIAGLWSWAANGFGNGENDAYFLLWSGISLLAIFTNGFFLFGRRSARSDRQA